MCAIVVAFYWRDRCISAISAVVCSTVGFDGELWLRGVTGAGDVDINESR